MRVYGLENFAKLVYMKMFYPKFQQFSQACKNFGIMLKIKEH